MKTTDVLAYLVIIVTLIIVTFPLYVLVITSLKTNEEAFAIPPTFWPKNLVWTAYTSVLIGKWNLPPYALNSLLITSLSIGLTVLLGLPMAYALTRFKFGRNWNESIAFFIIGVRMLPPIVGLLPIFIVFHNLGLADTTLGMVLAYTALLNLPFFVFIMRGFLAEFPSEIVEAALMDGTSHVGVLVRMILPLAFAGIIATASLAFLQTWNEFILASFLTTRHSQTLPILISNFIGDNSFFWSEQTAASVISVIPPLIILLLVQKQLVRGLTLGAVKT